MLAWRLTKDFLGHDKIEYLNYLIILFIFFCPLINFEDFDDRFIIATQYFSCFGGTFLILFVFICLFLTKKTVSISLTFLDFAIIVVLFCVFILYLNQPTFSFYSLTFLKVGSVTIAYILFSFFIRFARLNLTVLIGIVSFSTLLISFHGILQYFKVISTDSFFSMLGIFKNPSILTNYLAIIFPLLISGLYLIDKGASFSKLIRLINILSVIAVVFVLFIANQRTALLASFFGSSFFLGVIYWGRIQNIYRTRGTLFIALFCCLFVLFISSLLYYSQIKTQSISGRLFIYGNTLTIIRDYWPFGVGINNFASVYNLYQAEWFSQNPSDIINASVASDVKTPFNEFLLLLSELGIIGLIFFIVVFIVVLKYCIRVVKEYSFESANIVVIATIGGLISVFVCSFFSYPFEESAVVLLAVFFLAYLNNGQKQIRKNIIGRSCLFFPIIGTILFLVLTAKSYLAHKNWEKVAITAQNGKFIKAEYNDLYPILKSNYNFLYNYGVELLYDGDFDESIKILEEAKRYSIDSDLLVFLGDGYKSKSKYREAENCYKTAISMVPKKFIPRYALMQLYIDNNDCQNAMYWANDIINMKETVPGLKVNTIKEKANEVLTQSCKH